MTTFQPNQRVRILLEDHPEYGNPARVYDYLPWRPYPWHARPESWEPEAGGIAFTAEELEPIEDREEVKHHG